MANQPFPPILLSSLPSFPVPPLSNLSKHHSVTTATMVYLEPPPQLLQLLHQSLPTNGNSINDETAEILAYVATLASSIETYEPADWVSALEPYLSTLPSFTDAPTDECAKTIEAFLSKSQALLAQHDESSDEEDAFGGEQITDIRFSLAYGGKILLHQTKLRLRRGHVYALVGQNGVGKTSKFCWVWCMQIYAHILCTNNKL